MAPDTLEIERPGFEAYILAERGGDYLPWEGADYLDDFVQEAWETRQARACVAASASA